MGGAHPRAEEEQDGQRDVLGATWAFLRETCVSFGSQFKEGDPPPNSLGPQEGPGFKAAGTRRQEVCAADP